MTAIDDFDSIFADIRSGGNGRTLYMVLDAAIKDELPARLWQQDAPERVVPLIEHEGNHELLAASPFLVSMGGAGPCHDYLINLAKHEPAGIFLVSHEPWQRVVEEVRAWLWPEKQNGQPVYFRYYDPRVLSAVLQYHQKKGLLCPTGSFSQVFWHDPLRGKTFCVKAKSPGKRFALSSPWRFSAEFEEDLAAIQVLHRVTAALSEVVPAFYRPFLPGEIYERVESFAAQAESYGFFSFADVLLFCHTAFIYPGFTEHDNIRTVFAALKGRRHNRSFQEVLNGLPAEWLNECKPYRSDYHG